MTLALEMKKIAISKNDRLFNEVLSDTLSRIKKAAKDGRMSLTINVFDYPHLKNDVVKSLQDMGFACTSVTPNIIEVSWN